MKAGAEPTQQFRLQNRRLAAVASAQVAKGCRADSVIAFKKLLNPAQPKRGDLGHFTGRMTLRQKADRLEMPRRCHVLASLVTIFQLGDAEMLDDNGHARLLRIMAILNINAQPAQESPPKRVFRPETV